MQGLHCRPLQALVVLDYKLNIDTRTAAAVSLGRGRETLSSTTRNQSSSELQMGRNRNRAPPSPNRDEVPCLGSEGPHQLGEELPITNTALFIIRNIKNHHPTVYPCWSSEGPRQLPLQFTVLMVAGHHRRDSTLTTMCLPFITDVIDKIIFFLSNNNQFNDQVT